MLTRGTAAAALVVVSLALAGCGSSGGSNSSQATPTKSTTWFQIRPVLTEAKATAADCKAAPVAEPPVAAPVASACSTDGSTVYSLGPAALTRTAVDGIGTLDEGGKRILETVLTASGSTTYADLTAGLAKKSEPQDQVAALVDGVVVSTREISTSVTSGKLQLPFADAAAADALSMRLAS